MEAAVGLPCGLAGRLPGLGMNIFSQMSALAAKHGAVNLGQGFPDFDCDAALVEEVARAMRAGHNQYAPMPGAAVLRQAIAAQWRQMYGCAYDWEQEVTVTAGATQALLVAIMACAGPGDEVVVLEPCYDSYLPAIELAGARAVRVRLRAGSFRPDFDALAAALSPRTRALVMNTPHNPSGTVWSAADMRRLRELLAPTQVALISDEVYEHMVYAPLRHESVARDAALAGRAMVVGSFGKTLHVTGWKVGFVLAPAALTAAFRKLHQFTVFCVNTAVQYGLAGYMNKYLECDFDNGGDLSPWRALPGFYEKRRDLFRAGLEKTRFRLLPCEGTYFQCVDYSDLAVPERDLPERDFCEWLAREVGVAAIPMSAFYADGLDQKMVRFCFAKRPETLQAALERLARL